MKMFKLFTFSLLVLFTLNFFSQKCYPQVASQYEKIEREVEREEELEKRIREDVKRPEIEEEEEGVATEESAEKVFIKKITVTGVTLFSEEDIRKITAPYENKELSLKEIHKIAGLITDLYRRNGYVTSRAYIRPQDLSDGVLEIGVFEGKMGRVKIEGNRYFKTKLIKKKMRLEEGDSFDYDLLRKSLVKINEHPDRAAKAVLIPGEKPGQTDIVLKVQDNQPFHVGFDFDNFASRYLDEKRYTLKINHNNFTGNDDIITFKLQKYDEIDHYILRSLRYILPFCHTWEVGFYGLRNKLKLGEELEDLDVRGKSNLLSLFVNKYIKDDENFDIRLTLGFDYKEIKNYQLGVETSKDQMRVVKLGADLDRLDKHGRSIFVSEFHYGIPKLWDGLDDVDSMASRAGSGGKFTKLNIWFLRLHKLPFNSSLLWKNQLQISPYILTSAEQFQGGGISNNRGYPPAEKIGDEGVSSVIEVSTPLHIMPKEWKVPFCDQTFYKAVTLIGFYDFAHTELKRPQSGEEKTETLRSVGCGLRLNIPDKTFSARLEFGWPLAETPSDGDHLHTWIEISKTF
ncbi:ShlB/FhaC/HecB family hemolysin secretion/activation protein [Candidatus Omnitrophota bacterium]